MSGEWLEGPCRALKTHMCHECGRTIDAGETYWRGACLGEGAPSTWKRCAHCRALIREIDVTNWEGLIYPAWPWTTDPGNWTEARWLASCRKGWRTRDGRLLPIPGDAS